MQPELKSALDSAVRCFGRGDRAAARRSLEDALRLSPGHPDALHMLANLDGEAGRLEAARSKVLRALQARPDFPLYLATLARIQSAQGADEEAVGSLARAAARAPSAELLDQLGLAQLRAGRQEEAARSFTRALELEPSHVGARVNLGVTRFTAGLPREAAGHLEQALAQEPGNGGIAQRLGLAWQASGEHEHALQALERALRLDPDSVALRTSAAISLTALGRFDEAHERFDSVLAADPDCADALAGKAELYEWQGRYSEGLTLLQPMLSAVSDEPAVLVVYARLLRRTGEAEKGLAALTPLAESGDLSGAPLRQLRFTMGDLNDDLGRHGEAFEWYRRAHEFRPNPFSRRAHKRFVANLKLRFSRENMARTHRSGLETGQPVFIVGMPRSGTSLTEQMLAAHADVYAAGERAHIGLIVAELASQANPESEELAALGRSYLDELGNEASRAVRITDKMPLNFLYLGWVAQLFPRARVVWCRRDPRDTGLSCYTTNFMDPALAFCDRLEDIALYQNACDELMRHWQAVLDLPVHELEYESLVQAPEATARRLLDFLGLQWNPSCLQFHELERVASTSSHAQVRQPIYTHAVGRWRRYASQLEPLISALQRHA